MLLEAIGAGLPAGLAIALSPVPIIGIVLLLAGARGRVSGPLFMLGWIVALAVVTVIASVVFGGADDPDSTSSAFADWGRIVAGSLLILLGVRKWGARPPAGDAPKVPNWMASLDTASPPKALVLGALLAGANPKHIVLAAAAATSMVEAGADGSDLVVALAVFVLVGSVTVIGAVVVRLAGGRAGVALLDHVRKFMVANGPAITVVVLMILGAKVLGDGLAGLGR